MKRFFTLATFPLIGLVLLATAWFWSARDFRLRFFGETAEGRIVGMALEREGGSDLVVGINTDLVLTQANGEQVRASYRDYSLVSTILPAGTSDHPSQLSPALEGVLADVVRGSAEDVRWALLRESRRVGYPRRIVRIEKTETVRGAFDLASYPEFALDDGKLALMPRDGEPIPTGEVTVRAVFDHSDIAVIDQNRGDSLVDYQFLHDGKPSEPDQKDFFLRTEPHPTQFLPVFGFIADGQPVARLSHIGRHGGPTLALVLFGPCRVYYDPANPVEAILMSDPGPVGSEPLAWFSEYCEGLFGQWGSTALIALAGLLFLGTGLILISLAVRPSHNLAISSEDR